MVCFTDILNILSLSELGVGTAITYALYAPIARRDIKTTDPDADVSEFLQDNSGLCCACRLMPDTIFGYFDEGSSRCESSDYNLSSVSA